MKQNVLLTIGSMLTAVFFLLHVADDIVRGFEPGGVANLGTVPILVVWLYATLVLAGRRSGAVIVLLLSVLAAGIPYLHFRGAGGVAGGRIAGSSGVLLWVWTLLALGVCAAFSAVLAAQELWRLRRARKPALETR
jgi:hypothetical protein